MVVTSVRRVDISAPAANAGGPGSGSEVQSGYSDSAIGEIGNNYRVVIETLEPVHGELPQVRHWFGCDHHTIFYHENLLAFFKLLVLFDPRPPPHIRQVEGRNSHHFSDFYGFPIEVNVRLFRGHG